MTRFVLFVVVLILTSANTAIGSPPNWAGPYQPCVHHNDLLNRNHMDLAVRISTRSVALAEQFARAMNFWSAILDMTWHEVNSEDCSIQLVDGTPEIFADNSGCACAVARSQFPDRRSFQGWIAFNPTLTSTTRQMFRDSTHEIGHLFGLQHNPNTSSVMFFDDFGQDPLLDYADLQALAKMHALRPSVSGRVTQGFSIELR